ncbi:17416_t:CDS:2, partial [Cetraspora pellucida]
TKGIQIALRRLKDNTFHESLMGLYKSLKCFTATNFYTENAVCKPEISPIIRFYGITKDVKGYMFVMQVAERGDLQKYLFDNFDKMKWYDDKLLILANIANGLRIIHENGLTHRNLHCRNVLIAFEDTVLSQNIQEIIQEIELYIKRNTSKSLPPPKNVNNSNGHNSSHVAIGPMPI